MESHEAVLMKGAPWALGTHVSGILLAHCAFSLGWRFDKEMALAIIANICRPSLINALWTTELQSRITLTVLQNVGCSDASEELEEILGGLLVSITPSV